MLHLILTDKNFREEVIESKMPVLVDFWAPWCPPCKIIDPILDELGKEFEGKVVLGKINSDENPQIVNQLGVMSLPTVILFKDGKPVKAYVGAQTKSTYREMIEGSL